MSRIAQRRMAKEGPGQARKNSGPEPVDDIERQFLEPVARYLAILQEWSRERLSDDTGNVPESEQP
jgi:hypothetical protein